MLKSSTIASNAKLFLLEDLVNEESIVVCLFEQGSKVLYLMNNLENCEKLEAYKLAIS